jgi:protein associated with RNAse G/E
MKKEFERHVLTYGYPPDLTAAIRKSKDEVQAMIANKEFPFVDGVIRALYQKFQDENKAVITPKA